MRMVVVVLLTLAAATGARSASNGPRAAFVHGSGLVVGAGTVTEHAGLELYASAPWAR